MSGRESGNFLRYDGTTGAFLDIFASCGGLEDPTFLVFTAVPEPASVTLLGIGALGVLGYGWRRPRGGNGPHSRPVPARPTA
jgi:hypothetical protein